mgnify:CR=1 FL=1
MDSDFVRFFVLAISFLALHIICIYIGVKWALLNVLKRIALRPVPLNYFNDEEDDSLEDDKN